MSVQIVKTTGEGRRNPLVVDVADTRDDAITLARLYAAEHADRIVLGNGTLHQTATGAAFVTNNGTPMSSEAA